MIRLFQPVIHPDTGENVKWVLKSGQLAEGKMVETFEGRLEELLGYPVLTTNSGTSALYLMYDCADIGRGSKVITSPITCAATNIPLLHLGAEIIWADVDENGLISTTSVDTLLREHPDCKHVIAVDYGGLPADHYRLQAVCANFGARLLVDAAQSFGAMQRGAVIGTYCDGLVYSFQAIKTLTAGDGGALWLRDTEAMRRAKLKRWFGLDRTQGGFRSEQDISEVGGKFHMNDIAAAIGLANLNTVTTTLKRSRLHAQHYYSALTGYESERFRLPDYKVIDEPSWWTFICRVSDQQDFVDHMAAHGVEAAKIHSRNDTKTIFKQFQREGLDGVALFDAQQVSIPVGSHLREDDVEHITKAVRKWAR